MQELFQLVPAAYVVFRRDSRVLLQLRQHTGFMDGHWACAAAGHVEAGESVLAAAVREAAEETGVLLDPADLVPLSTLHRTNGGGSPRAQRVDFFFAADVWRGEARIMEPEKCAAMEWFDLEDLPEPMPEHERYVLQNLAAGSLPAIASLGFGA
ncbi:NUDIX domain-containing protein [Paeniglutamicibacter psychrophenolicus]|uniref:NUDIX domain-containing protein n=1 Tax=Paeniglutamicibacter psychrophenolicus TaxID=257454 RepID=UPI00278236BA|nr:NUDIX domain-containing protein [Paeniglutamicibacter psychrophenolicus]MDQ0095246.1 8-oxo-dGTP pyrophosphatase MutT (NUDIX family) [Paeniglutamicibacter psychrophenolicus]